MTDQATVPAGDETVDPNEDQKVVAPPADPKTADTKDPKDFILKRKEEKIQKLESQLRAIT